MIPNAAPVTQASRRQARHGRTPQAKRGYVWAEVVICIPIVGVLIALSLSGFTQYYRFRSESMARQAAAWAAAAQLQRYQAGASLDSLPPAGTIPPDVTLKTTTKPGQGQWEGLQLATVTATYMLAENRSVREQISGYVRPASMPATRQSALTTLPAVHAEPEVTP